MCCLKYELLAYEEAKKKMPLIGAEYKIKEGVGIVISQNVMKNKIGLHNSTSKPVLILNTENIILNIAESVREVKSIIKLSRSCISNMLKMNKEVAGYKLAYANEDIVQPLHKCKSSTLKAFVGQKFLEVG